jgi:hypothetical protein
MDASSIYSDLKKFAGKIEAKKVSVMIELDKENAPEIPDDSVKIKKAFARPPRVERTPERKKTPTIAPVNTTPEITIESIAAMIKQPLAPIKDANGFVHDESTIAARCPRGHIHKYFLKDIIADSGATTRCHTCSSGNKFMIMTRELMETTLGTPFALSEKRLTSDINATEYINPMLKIVIVCARTPGIDNAIQINNYLVVKLHPTTSLRKVKDSIYKLLSTCDQLSEDTLEKIKLLASAPAKQPAVRPNAKRFVKDALPFTADLARVQIASMHINPIIAQMQMNIIDDPKLCLENC